MGAPCAVEGSGQSSQSQDGNAAQISSAADSSLTGIRGLPVNNRGSDSGQLAPVQSAHSSSITPFLSVSRLRGPNSQTGSG